MPEGYLQGGVASSLLHLLCCIAQVITMRPWGDKGSLRALVGFGFRHPRSLHITPGLFKKSLLVKMLGGALRRQNLLFAPSSHPSGGLAAVPRRTFLAIVAC